MKKQFVLALLGLSLMSGAPLLGAVKIDTSLTALLVTVPPTGAASQTFCSGATLENISINGTAINWYASSTSSTVLPLSTVLTANTTYYATQTLGGIESTARLAVTITLNALPLALTAQPLHYCDPNNDGSGLFYLNSTVDAIAGGTLPPNTTVRFYETQTDAVVAANPSLFSPYYNSIPWAQTVFVNVTNTVTGCSSYSQLQLIVDPTPEPTVPTDYHLCDTTGALGQEAFDLTTKISEILGSINPAIAYVQFHPDQACAIEIENIQAFLNYSPVQTIYAKVHFTATGCSRVVPLVLVVDPLPFSTQPAYPSYTLCDTPQYGVCTEAFNLASQIPSILLGQPNMVVSFYPSFAAAQNNTGTITNTTNYINVSFCVQTLGIRITNVLTGCYALSTMDIRVTPAPVLIPPATPYRICDNDQDGFATFDLTSLTPDLLQGSAYAIAYFESSTPGTLPIANPGHYQNTVPYAQLIYAQGTDVISGCVSYLPLELHVDPAPITPNLPDIYVCDPNLITTTTALVNLSVNTPFALVAQNLPASIYTVMYYQNQASAAADVAPILLTSAYTAFNGETIWVRIQNNTTGCFALDSFQILLNQPLENGIVNYGVCDDDDNPTDQLHVFDLTVGEGAFTQGLQGFTTTYYESYPITSESPVISDPNAYTTTVAGQQTLGVKVSGNHGCITNNSLILNVYLKPQSPVITLAGTTLNSNITDATVQWYNQDGLIAGATGSSYSPLTNGNYYAVYSPTLGYCSSVPSNSITIGNLGLPTLDAAALFALYPNPTQQSVSLVASLFIPSDAFSIHDVLGKSLLQGQLTGVSTMIDCSALAKGVYMVSVSSTKGTQTLRLVKQ